MSTDHNYGYADYAYEPDPSHRPMYLDRVLLHLKTMQQTGHVTTVLDAGCGGGDFAIGLNEAGFQVFGFDLNESAIHVAQQRNVGTFVISSIYEDYAKPFGVTSFDAIVSVEVIEHLYSPRIFVTRAKQALRAGGLLIVTTPYWGYVKNIALAVSNRTDKALTALWDGGHIKHWSKATLMRLMNEQGFEFVAFHGCGEGIRRHVPYLWNGMVMVFRKA